jgi:hypothetical protein
MLIFLVLSGALLIGLFMIVILQKREKVQPMRPPIDTVNIPVRDTGAAIRPDTLKPEISDTPMVIQRTKPRMPVRIDTMTADTPPPVTPPDTAGTTVLPTEQPAGECAKLTGKLWVYPEPSGGLHRGTITIRFISNRPCSVSWQYENDPVWNLYTDDKIVVDTTIAILFKAVDRCGNVMPTREELYVIEPEVKTDLCPPDMDLVQIGKTRFCIDRYEWPNRKGAPPLAYISLYQASDSCFSKKKRLCTSEEWSLACSGPHSWSFPYGQKYEPYACVTSDTAPKLSGSKPECRAYFGTFDMSGNLMEWTSTPSRENRHFNNIMGGFWESGPRSGCFEKRYSYFPQNRHNPVGFRCCKDVSGTK